jgi:hypothetical protein
VQACTTKKDWQRQDAQARCLDSQDSFGIRYISTLSKDKFYIGLREQRNSQEITLPTFYYFTICSLLTKDRFSKFPSMNKNLSAGSVLVFWQYPVCMV